MLKATGYSGYMNKILKNGLLVATIIALLFYMVWIFGYISISSADEITRQTYSIMAGVKLLTVIVFYIAWRVTPEE